MTETSVNETTRESRSQIMLDWQVQAANVPLVDGNVSSTTTEVFQIVEEQQGDADEQRADHPDNVMDIYTPNYELQTFLKRPVRLATYAIPQGESGNVYRDIQPWYSFFNDTTIRKKLDNYAYFRGNLHVEFVINSTPFVYGCYMASYHPMINYSSFQNYTTDPVLSSDQKIRIPLSQRQNVRLYSHTNQGGTMVLPFVWHRNFLNITSAQDCQDMGILSLVPMAPFATATAAATGAVQLSVYAWVEDFHLAGQTVSLAVQSKDEYMNGPISRPASIVAGIGQKLSAVPVIGKYASALSIGAGAVGKIASLFGFTNIPVIENSMPFKNQPFHGFASSQIAGPIEKLTIDPKNGLDLSLTNIGHPDDDDLAISALVQRESFLGSTTWQPADTVDTVLFSANVSPTMCITGTSSGGYTWYADSPMGNVARLFTNWRGDVYIRLRIIASQYHQGRLRVSFDPRGNLATATSSTQIQTAIIDIQNGEEFTFCIPYMQPQNWMLIQKTVVGDALFRGSITGYTDTIHNGVFTVSVLNPITAPTTTANATVLVYVQGSENTEFANPSDVDYNASVLVPQSKDEIVLGDSTPVPKERYAVNFGEQIASVRQIMRRHTLIERIPYVTGSIVNPTVFRLRDYMGMYPPEPGYLPAGTGYLGGRSTAPGVITPASSFNVNYTNHNPYTWLATCFIGQRGAMMHAYNWVGSECQSLTATRWNYPVAASTIADVFGSVTALNNWAYSGYSTIAGNTGFSVTNQKTQTGMQVHVPFMNRFNFASTDPRWRIAGNATDNSSSNLVVAEKTFIVPTSGNVTGYTDHYACIGADFQFVKFLSVPIRYTYSVANPAL